MSYIFYVRDFTHYFLHFVFPVFVALAFYRSQWKQAYLLMLATMVVDLDHVWATPLFDAHRSSVGFHPFHSYYAVAVYVLGAIFLRGKARIVAVGLVLHMLTDFQDYHVWKHILNSR